MIETRQERLAKINALVADENKQQAYIYAMELYRDEPRDKDVLLALVQSSPNPVLAFWYWHQLRQTNPNDPQVFNLFKQVVKELYTWLRTTGKSLVTEPEYEDSVRLLREMLDTTSLEADEKEVLEWIIVKAGLGQFLGLGGGSPFSVIGTAILVLGLAVALTILFPAYYGWIVGVTGVVLIGLGIWFIFQKVLFLVDAGRIAIKASKILMRHAKKRNLFGLAKNS
jgi:hypothetical protein